MNRNKERWLGGVILLCGAGMVAMLITSGNKSQQEAQLDPAAQQAYAQVPPEDGQAVSAGIPNTDAQFRPLALDIQDEQRLLEAQRQQREAAVAQQEAKTDVFLAQQQQAENNAAQMAAAENKKPVPIAPLPVTTSTTTAAAAQDATREQLLKEAATAQARREQEQQAKRLAEQKKKAEAEKAKPKRGEKVWMVQVALSVSPSATDAIVSRLRAKGYKVVTSKTSKGTRVLVGPQPNREAAARISNKIHADSSLGLPNSWVINWQPLL